MTPQQILWNTEEKLSQLTAWKSDGMTDAEIAAQIGICHATLCDWKRVFPAINAAIEAGKTRPIEQAENALYKIMIGYDVEEKTVVGKEIKGKFIPEDIKIHTKHIPPNITALRFFLINQDPAHWRPDSAPVPEDSRPKTKLELYQAKQDNQGNQGKKTKRSG